MKMYTFLNRLGHIVFILGILAGPAIAITAALSVNEIEFYEFVCRALLGAVIMQVAMMVSAKFLSMAQDMLEKMRKEEEMERELRARKELKKLYRK